MKTDAAPDRKHEPVASRAAGSILAAERERQGLSRADIAQRLHISVTQIEALESADYGRFPRGPFLRGFTRNYARTLGLDAEKLVSLVTEGTPNEAASHIVVPSQNIRFDPMGARLANPYVKAAGIAAAVIVLGFVAMYWWLFIRPGGAPATAVRKPAVEAPKVESVPVRTPMSGAAQPASPASADTQVPPPSEPAAVPAPAPQSASQPAPQSAMQPSPKPASQPAPQSAAGASAAPAQPARGAVAVAGAGESTIRLAFKGAAWVEIADASGQSLVSRNHAAGSSTDVFGKPPFRVVIGNAPEVRMTYNGRDVDLAPHTRVSVARFTLQ